jgi:hypothetical protein
MFDEPLDVDLEEHITRFGPVDYVGLRLPRTIAYWEEFPPQTKPKVSFLFFKTRIPAYLEEVISLFDTNFPKDEIDRVVSGLRAHYEERI